MMTKHAGGAKAIGGFLSSAWNKAWGRVPTQAKSFGKGLGKTVGSGALGVALG